MPYTYCIGFEKRLELRGCCETVDQDPGLSTTPSQRTGVRFQTTNSPLVRPSPIRGGNPGSFGFEITVNTQGTRGRCPFSSPHFAVEMNIPVIVLDTLGIGSLQGHSHHSQIGPEYLVHFSVSLRRERFESFQNERNYRPIWRINVTRAQHGNQ